MKVFGSMPVRRRSSRSMRRNSLSNTPADQHDDSESSQEGPVRTSCDDLRFRPDARQLLKQQFVSTFPDASPAHSPRPPLQQSSPENSSPEVPSRNRTMAHKVRSTKSDVIPVPSQLADDDLSSMLDISSARKRLSVVQENKIIDIESTINLLQELKKTATPEELVALHRALLPTKDIDSVAKQSDAMVEKRDETIDRPLNSATYIPSKSPLRKPAGPRGPRSPLPEKKQSHTPSGGNASSHKHSDSTTSIAALDLADRVSTATSAGDIATSTDLGYLQLSSHKPGMLRITHGDSSVELRVHATPSAELKAMLREQSKNTSPRQAARASIDFHPGRGIHARQSRLDQHISTTPSDTNQPLMGTVAPAVRVGRSSAQSNRSEAARESTKYRRTPLGRPDETVPMSAAFRTAQSPTNSQGLPSTPPSGVQQKPSSPTDSADRAKALTPRPARLAASLKSHSYPTVPTRTKDKWGDTGHDSDDSGDADRRSLYTFEEILSSPPTRPESPPKKQPVSRSTSKRQILFTSLKPRRSVKRKLGDATKSVDSTHSVANILTSEPVTSQDTKALAERSKQSSKKLTKPVPEHVKQAQKARKRAERDQSITSALSSSNTSLTLDSHPSSPEWNSSRQRTMARASLDMLTFEDRTAPTSRISESHRGRSATASSSATSQNDGRLPVLSEAADGNDLSPIDSTSRNDLSANISKNLNDTGLGDVTKYRLRSPLERGRARLTSRTKGMDEKAASEYARKRSRDVVERDLEQKRAMEETKVSSPSVEDRFPDWHRQNETKKIETSNNRNGFYQPFVTYSESVPPMPQLPAKFDNQARLADEMILKRVRNGPGTDEHVKEVVVVRKSSDRKRPNEQTTPRASHFEQDNDPDSGSYPNSATFHADAYRDLIGDVQDGAQVSRSSSTKSTRKSVTLDNAARFFPLGHVGPPNAMPSWSQPHLSAASLARAYTPGGHMRTPSGRILNQDSLYSSNAIPRLQNLANINTTAIASSDNLPINLAPLSSPVDRPNSSMGSHVDHRYTGGLQYEWKRGIGFGGSAGTRNSVQSGAQRSVRHKQDYGLDLSDVPVFLRKTTATDKISS